MVARLWWKDARQFWPIWVLLAVIGLAAQWLALHYFGEKARSGELAVAALGWTCLYAFAIAAAAFAGERESRTLILLDALPVERWRVWMGKVSFAFVSTLGLGLLLLFAAALATDKWQVVTPWWGILEGVAALLLVLGCGLFWSAVMSNTLLAAVLAVCTALPVVPAINDALNLNQDHEKQQLYELVLGFLSLVASGLLFIRSGPPLRPLIRRRVQPLTTRPAAAPVAVATQVPRRLRFWPAAARSLAWQTFRDVRSIWWWLALLCLVVPLCLYSEMPPNELPGFWMLCVLAANIMAGVSVFGIENRARTHVFLANEGVQPGLVWLIKTSIWLAAMVVLMVVLWVLTFLVSAVFGGLNRIALPSLAEALFFGGVVLITLAVPILCGMVIRRGITAGIVALLVLILVLPSLFGLYAMRMLPSVFLMLIPLAFLAVSLAWSRDWMLDRPGARRWVKLAVLLAGCFGPVFAAYVAVRVEGVPTLDPVREAQLFSFTTPTSVAAADNAADLYRQAAKSISGMPLGVYEMSRDGWILKAENGIAWYRDNARRLELVREAAAMPACQFTPLDKLTMFSSSYAVGNANSDMTLISPIPTLLALSVLDHQARGDLDEAWNDLVVMFRIARQWSGAVPVFQAWSSLSCERVALSRAMVWAADAKQTPERLRSALDAYRKLPPMPNPAEPIRAEAQIIRNAEKLPRAELVDMYLKRGLPYMWMGKLRVDAMATPWELARTGKALRLLLASKIEAAQVEPWYVGTRVRWRGEPLNRALITGTPGRILDFAALLEIEASTPLVQWVLPPIDIDSYLDYSDRNEVKRRALVQILALRVWQLRHDGRLPEKLQDLVTSGLLDELPADPYTPGHHFGYVRSSGQELLPLGELGPLRQGFGDFSGVRSSLGSRLLYSVGPDRQDDGARTNETNTGLGDLVFPLAESTTSGKGGSPH